MKQFSILKAIKGKPSIALQHMVNGLLKQSKRKKFQIAMQTYGNSSDGICYGCAATCAIQSIAKINLTPKSIKFGETRAERTKTEWEELDRFECAINMARQGTLKYLFDFCGIDRIHSFKFNDDFDLGNNDWEEQLPKVRKTIAKLKKAGY